MKLPAPLSPAARQLLEAGSPMDLPTPEASERMGHALAPLLRRDPSLPPEVARPLARRADRIRNLLGGGAAKLALTLEALATTATGAFWLGRATQHAERAEAVPAPRQPSPALSLLPLPLPPPASELPAPLDGPEPPPPEASSARRRPTRAPRALTAAAPPAKLSPEAGASRRRTADIQPRGLGAEVAQLQRAELALRQGRARQALSYLDGSKIEYLPENAAALRAIAECELGPGASAHGDANALFEHWPRSAFAARVRQACNGPRR